MVLADDIQERRVVNPAIKCWSLAKWHDLRNWIDTFDFWMMEHRVLTINKNNNEVVLYYGAVLIWAHRFPEYRRKWGLGGSPAPKV